MRYDRARDPRWLRGWNRLAAVVVFCYVIVHIGVMSLARVSPERFADAVAIYQHPVAVVAAVALVGLLVLHTLAGLRILLIDFTAWGLRRADALVSGVFVLWLALMVPIGYLMLRHTVQTLWGAE